MLSITISIGDVETEMTTDQNLSFDAIDSLLSRAVQATLQSYLSLPAEDRLAGFGTDDDDEELE
ncbi:MAG: hypothetical protein EBZ61_11210 [Micrococcales bacterium]|jgi:hypothetical protein|nr:hypothetical protein [Micrococcales bacterium]